ncbi:hypothetical protein TTHERM_00194800 (macronuclear) [Tetrahymena thermophila SB210]|uniref:Nucleoporin n=1 Tax=Tetrahymena thermophila (strain SB210) TaxID=312017 RepID=Q23K55_TETTS|nr:hypothetical protein TTHERM_00194800 [Tetrahymena thermophila SB210]EAR96988.3 hypothetical protein TTHERM_00194800 [Tetrahymena thermophila SB210]|eukprot:XP_001017233.3 hypothetical protein TTHERM_00194800 [Tetrahymena thermophila SB210]
MSLFNQNQGVQIGGQKPGGLFQTTTTGQQGGGLFNNQPSLQLGGNQTGGLPVFGGNQQPAAGGTIFNNPIGQQAPAQGQGGIFANQKPIVQNQTQTNNQQQIQHTVQSQTWKEAKQLYQQLQNVKKEQISIERDVNVSDNNNIYAHKPVNILPKEFFDELTNINKDIQKTEQDVAKLVDSQRELFNQIQETRKVIQQSSLSLKQTAQQVKDIQETVNELITEQQDQKQYITNFFYTFTNYLENHQFPRLILPQPFIIKAQEKFQLKLEKLQRQIDEVEQMLQVEIQKRNDEEELAFIFVIVEQLFKYFNNVTALVYEFHKHYESFRMKIVHIQDQREFGFASDLNESTKQSLNEENRYFKLLSNISDNLEKQIRKHEEEQQIKQPNEKRI